MNQIVVKHTQKGKTIPNIRKTLQMATKYTNIFHFKALKIPNNLSGNPVFESVARDEKYCAI
jgi:hypothetical protein